MSKSTKISDFWYAQAQNLMGERTGLYSVKAVIERAIEEMTVKYPSHTEGS